MACSLTVSSELKTDPHTLHSQHDLTKLVECMYKYLKSIVKIPKTVIWSEKQKVLNKCEGGFFLHFILVPQLKHRDWLKGLTTLQCSYIVISPCADNPLHYKSGLFSEGSFQPSMDNVYDAFRQDPAV